MARILSGVYDPSSGFTYETVTLDDGAPAVGWEGSDGSWQTTDPDPLFDWNAGLTYAQEAQNAADAETPYQKAFPGGTFYEPNQFTASGYYGYIPHGSQQNRTADILTQAAVAAGMPDYDFNYAAVKALPEAITGIQTLWDQNSNPVQAADAILQATGVPALQAQIIPVSDPLYQQGIVEAQQTGQAFTTDAQKYQATDADDWMQYAALAPLFAFGAGELGVGLEAAGSTAEADTAVDLATAAQAEQDAAVGESLLSAPATSGAVSAGQIVQTMQIAPIQSAAPVVADTSEADVAAYESGAETSGFDTSASFTESQSVADTAEADANVAEYDSGADTSGLNTSGTLQQSQDVDASLTPSTSVTDTAKSALNTAKSTISTINTVKSGAGLIAAAMGAGSSHATGSSGSVSRTIDITQNTSQTSSQGLLIALLAAGAVAFLAR